MHFEILCDLDLTLLLVSVVTSVLTLDILMNDKYCGVPTNEPPH